MPVDTQTRRCSSPLYIWPKSNVRSWPSTSAHSQVRIKILFSVWLLQIQSQVSGAPVTKCFADHSTYSSIHHSQTQSFFNPDHIHYISHPFLLLNNESSFLSIYLIFYFFLILTYYSHMNCII